MTWTADTFGTGPRRPGTTSVPVPGAQLQSHIDALIRRADQADGAAVDELFAVLYAELHLIAKRALAGNSGTVTLGVTTLLHEAYLSISGRDALAFADHGRFLAYASRAMRGLVVDFARRQRAHKRGGHLEITLDNEQRAIQDCTATGEELTNLSQALDDLAGLEPALAELVDLHFFGGFSFVEIATMRGVSERTVQRDWRKARLLLHRHLEAES